MEAFKFFIPLIMYIILCVLAIMASDKREGVSQGAALIVSLIFTPLFGFLYVLSFPFKKQE